MLVHGLQRVEGRVWSTQHKGPLWIHAAAREPSSEEIAEAEEFYGRVFSLDAPGGGEVQAPLPSAYPTSALVGLVELTECVHSSEFANWETLPPGARVESTAHGSDYFFLIERHRRMPLPLKMAGQHKLWRLERALARSLLGGGLKPSEVMPIDWSIHRQAARARMNGTPQSTLTPRAPPAAPAMAVVVPTRRPAAATAAAAGTAAVTTKAKATRDAAAVGDTLRESVANAPEGEANSTAPANADGGDAFDQWMLTQALALSAAASNVPLSADDDGLSLGRQLLPMHAADAEVAAAFAESELLIASSDGDDTRHDDPPSLRSAPTASSPTPQDEESGIVLSAAVKKLERMGFQKARAAEMLELAGGDIERAVAFLL
jgi:hypothetical protein